MLFYTVYLLIGNVFVGRGIHVYIFRTPFVSAAMYVCIRKRGHGGSVKRSQGKEKSDAS